jgi:hypothetical protein
MHGVLRPTLPPPPGAEQLLLPPLSEQSPPSRRVATVRQQHHCQRECSSHGRGHHRFSVTTDGLVVNVCRPAYQFDPPPPKKANTRAPGLSAPTEITAVRLHDNLPAPKGPALSFQLPACLLLPAGWPTVHPPSPERRVASQQRCQSPHLRCAVQLSLAETSSVSTAPMSAPPSCDRICLACQT